MKLKLEVITKWLKDSGLVVNEKKTELCLFHKNPQPLVELQINNDLIKSKNIINVLGITFDSQMKWEQQVSQAIKNSRRALHGIGLIRKNFNKSELKQLLTSYFYSVLYYNSEVWQLPTLHNSLKKQLLAASAAGLKILSLNSDLRISFEQLHSMNERATPIKMMHYKLALQLYKNFNDVNQNETWMDLNFQQNF